MRERSTLASSLVLLSVLAAGSYWLALRARLLDPVAKQARHDVDYYAEHFELVRMDVNGKPTYQLGAEHMAHFADDDSTRLTKPQMVTLTPDKPIVHVHSKDGDVSSGGDLVHLLGDVTLWREPSGDDPGLTATATRMTVLPDEDIAKTDVPVHVVHGHSTMDGETMYFNDTDQYLKLNDGLTTGRTYLSIEPRAKPAIKAATKPAPAKPQ